MSRSRSARTRHRLSAALTALSLTSLALAVPTTTAVATTTTDTARSSTTATGTPGGITFLAGDPGKGPATSVGIDPQEVTVAPDGTMFAASNDLIFHVDPNGSTSAVIGRGSNGLPSTADVTVRPAQEVGRMADVPVVDLTYTEDGQRTTVGGMDTDSHGNVVFSSGSVYILARSTGTMYGRAMQAGNVYRLLGGGTSMKEGAVGYRVGKILGRHVAVDPEGTVLAWVGGTFGCRLMAVPATTGVHLGRQMQAGRMYVVQDPGFARRVNCEYNSVSTAGGLLLTGGGQSPPVVTPDHDGTWFGIPMQAGQHYTLPLTAEWNTHFDLTAEGDVLTINGFSEPILAAQDGTRYGKTMTAGETYNLAFSHPESYVSGPAGTLLAVDLHPSWGHAGRAIYALTSQATSLYGTPVPADTVTRVAGTGGALSSTDGVNPGQYQIPPENIWNSWRFQAGQVGTPVSGLPDGSYAITSHGAVSFAPATSGSYFGRAMTAGKMYRAIGVPDNEGNDSGHPLDGQAVTEPAGALTSAVLTPDAIVGVNDPRLTSSKNLTVSPLRSGTFFGRAMEAGKVYVLTGDFRGSDRIAASGHDVVRTHVDPASYGDVLSLVAAQDTQLGGIALPAGQLVTIAGGALHDGLHYGEPATNSTLLVYGTKRPYAAPDGTILLQVWNSGRAQPELAFVPREDGVKFGRQVKAGYLYRIAGGTGADGSPVSQAQVSEPLVVDTAGNILMRLPNDPTTGAFPGWRVLPFQTGSFYGIPMTAKVATTIPGTAQNAFTELSNIGDGVAGFHEKGDTMRLFRLER